MDDEALAETIIEDLPTVMDEVEAMEIAGDYLVENYFGKGKGKSKSKDKGFGKSGEKKGFGGRGGYHQHRQAQHRHAQQARTSRGLDRRRTIDGSLPPARVRSGSPAPPAQGHRVFLLGIVCGDIVENWVLHRMRWLVKRSFNGVTNSFKRILFAGTTAQPSDEHGGSVRGVCGAEEQARIVCVPIGLGDQSGVLRVEVVPGNTPFLTPACFLSEQRALIDTKNLQITHTTAGTAQQMLRAPPRTCCSEHCGFW